VELGSNTSSSVHTLKCLCQNTNILTNVTKKKVMAGKVQQQPSDPWVSPRIRQVSFGYERVRSRGISVLTPIGTRTAKYASPTTRCIRDDIYCHNLMGEVKLFRGRFQFQVRV
jgi:hypothetical protein